MTLTANLSLDDLGLDSTLPGPAPTAASPLPTWPFFLDRRPGPEPLFPFDFLARVHDVGGDYGVLLRWVEERAWHRRPIRHSDVMVNDTTDANLPPHLALALARDETESERDHLLRLGHQAAVFDQPDIHADVSRRGRRVRVKRDRWYRSLIFFDLGPHPSIEQQMVMATSPLTVDRVALLERGNCPVRVLRVLAHDPNPLIRCSVLWHRKADASVRAEFADEPDPTVLSDFANSDPAARAASRRRQVPS